MSEKEQIEARIKNIKQKWIIELETLEEKWEKEALNNKPPRQLDGTKTRAYQEVTAKYRPQLLQAGKELQELKAREKRS